MSLYPSPQPGVLLTGKTFNPEAALLTSVTGLDASFSFSVTAPGTFHVDVQKAGYGRFGPFLRSSTTSADITLSPEHTSGEIRFQLAMPGAISGSVVDSSADFKPISGLRIVLWQRFYKQRKIEARARRGLIDECKRQIYKYKT